MGLIGGKAIIVVAVFLVLVGWGAGNGYIKVEHDNYKCFETLHYYSAVPKQRLITFGAVHVYYQPLTFGCDKDHQYDPKMYKPENGILVPVGN